MQGPLFVECRACSHRVWELAIGFELYRGLHSGLLEGLLQRGS